MSSFNPDSKTGPIQLGVSFEFSKEYQAQHGDLFRRFVWTEITQALADRLSRECLEITEGEYSTEYRAKVWVLTTDQLARLVHEKAQKLARSYPFTFNDDQSPF